MKTIKELVKIEGCKYGPTWDGQNMGYFEALKDILKLLKNKQKKFQGRNDDKSKLVWDILQEIIEEIEG